MKRLNRILEKLITAGFKKPGVCSDDNLNENASDSMEPAALS